MSQTNNNEPGPRVGATGAVLVGFALVLCCAGPALIAGGALSAIGGVLSNPLVIALGVMLILAAVLVTLRRRATRDLSCHPRSPRTEQHHQ